MAANNRFNPLASPVREEAHSHDGVLVEGSTSTAPTTATINDETATAASGTSKRRRSHRGGKKKRSRRKSFAAPLPDINDSSDSRIHGDSNDTLTDDRGGPMYRLGTNMSTVSFGSSNLFDDHRSHAPMRPRRQSTHISHVSLGQSLAAHGGASLSHSHSHLHPHGQSRDVDGYETDEESPLLARPGSHDNARVGTGYGSRMSKGSPRAPSRSSSRNRSQVYGVNFPASHPNSPMLGSIDPMTMSFGDVMIRDADIDMSHHSSPRHSITGDGTGHTTLLDPAGPRGDKGESYSGDASHERSDQVPDSYGYTSRRRRRKWPDLATLEEWSRYESKEGGKRVKRITEPQLINGRLRPLRKGWYVTEEDAPYRFTYFNEDFAGTIHSQTISELLHEGGSFKELFRPEPRIISDDESGDDSDDDEVVAVGLRKPEGVDGDSKIQSRQPSVGGGIITPEGEATQVAASRRPSKTPSPQPQLGLLSQPSSLPTIKHSSPSPRTSSQSQSRPPQDVLPPLDLNEPPVSLLHREISPSLKPVRYGDRPVWWLDVLCPTEAEMKVISKAFGIHPLTAEDIMMQEAREKVELFRNYYFVNYRTFDQDVSSENYLEPVNMYVVVFREGVLSFHFSMTPHAANVRRRIRQLKDYLILSSDWISYAIIDDITDVFGPLIQHIEDEVDEIDEAILRLHEEDDDSNGDPEKREARKREAAQAGIMYPGGPRPGKPASVSSSSSAGTLAAAGGDMLRKVGNCRKRVMSLFRLLGNKADVIKGFAKRCNERWEVAPRSEIGLYLGDIQDHIVTMTGNLGHYEKILARSHANYLAQINIRMTARQEQTADVLGKLTVLGTIVLPMNIITGLWGMNVWVPGQEYEGDLTWFWCITAGLLAFGGACYMIAKRVYGIV